MGWKRNKEEVKSETKGTIKLREVKTLVTGASVMSDLAGLRDWLGGP